MSNYIPGIGPSTAKLAIVGEAPGAEEDRLGYPFAGATGKISDRLLSENGSDRSKVYLTNVVKHRPPANDLRLLPQIGHSIDEYIPILFKELEALKPNAILAYGNLALEALTGLRGIEKHRGSILWSPRANCKVIPSIHPASLLHKEADGKMRAWKDITFIGWDVKRAIEQSRTSNYDPPRRNLIVCRSSRDLSSFLDQHSDKDLVSVDIETFKTFPICIGLAFSKNEAMSIPLFNVLGYKNDKGIGRSDMLYIWSDLAKLLADPAIQKIGQNFKFDGSLLNLCYDRTVNFGMKVRGFYFDTQLGFRTLYPELPGKLEFIASVLTEEPYWKDEGKEFNPKKDSLDKLLLYNAKDAAVTFECYERELAEMQESGIDKFFFERVMPLNPFYERVEGRGILRDTEVQKALDKKYTEIEASLMLELQSVLDKLESGYSVTWKTGKKSVKLHNSPTKVAQLLYHQLKIPPRKGAGEDVLEALLRNVIKDPLKKRCVSLILELRKVSKTRGTYINCEAHHDGRLRTGVRIMLETGRTSTSVLKPPVTTKSMGCAFQTITKHGEVGTDIREMYIPDKGFTFIEPDLSQAEGRVVALLANDLKLLKLFKYGVDIHRVTAGWIFSRCPDLNPFFNEVDDRACREWARVLNKELKSVITEDERQLGKKFRHAGHYAMGKHEASKQTGLSEYKCNIILEQFHGTNPNIQKTYHEGVKQILQDNNRWMRTGFGRTRQFLNRWGDQMFKEAYAYIPQSMVSDHLKFSAQRIEKRCVEMQILQESHDSFLAQAPKALVDRYLPIIQEELEMPLPFGQCSFPRGELIIPCEIKIGTKNWKEMERVI